MPDYVPDAYVIVPLSPQEEVQEKAQEVVRGIERQTGTTVSVKMVKYFMLGLVERAEPADHPWYASSFLKTYGQVLWLSVLEEEWSDEVWEVLDRSVTMIAEALFGEDENWAAFRMALEARIDDSVQSNERRSR
jgi:hypothetical protein